MGKILISPSILSADFGNLREAIKKLDACRVDSIHLDVMDGHFVPNITFGPAVIASIRSATDIPFETHLMIEQPEKYVREFADAGSDTIIVHCEAKQDIAKTMSIIKSCGVKAGIAINPETPFGIAKKYLHNASLLLVMSVHPGFGGQKFISGSLEKIREAKACISREGYKTMVAVDGGIDLKTGRMAVSAGADELIAGNAIFGSKDVSKSIEQLGKLSQKH